MSVTIPESPVTLVRNTQPTLALEMFEEYGDTVLEKLEEAVETAKTNEKDKIRKTSVPDPKKDAEKRMKKSAHFLVEILKNVRQDAGYMSLSVGNREYIEKTLDDIEPKEETAVDPAQAVPAVGPIW